MTQKTLRDYYYNIPKPGLDPKKVSRICKPEIRFYKGQVEGKMIGKQPYMKTAAFRIDATKEVIICPIRMLYRGKKS
ncbi:MAG: hypothetical protein ACTSRA_00035 [Promethearchaeota archaeon]